MLHFFYNPLFCFRGVTLYHSGECCVFYIPSLYFYFRGVDLYHPGECCTGYNPVCGANDRTYNNECELNLQ